MTHMIIDSMYKSAKRVYTELNTINIKNHENPNSKKFIIDKTPFNDDPSEAPTIVKDDHGEYYIITGRILPTSNIYNRSAFIIKLKVPTEYPFKPPQVEMVTPIYHPNVGPQGKICIPMLRSTNAWKATNTLTDVIDSVVAYIDCPNIDEAESSDIANEYLKNRKEFDRKATETVERNMVSRQ